MGFLFHPLNAYRASSSIGIEPMANPYRDRVSEFSGRIIESANMRDKDLVSEYLRSSPKVFCDIGSGSGGHLLELATLYPEACCFGFELRFKRSVRTLEKAIRLGIDNVFVLRVDAAKLGELFPENSVDGVFVNFPDPWSKPRQLKHRILSEPYLDLLFSVLKTGGALSFKTDHMDYFDSFLSIVNADTRFTLSEFSRNLAESDYTSRNIVTEFERLFLSQGCPIYYLRVTKK